MCFYSIHDYKSPALHSNKRCFTLSVFLMYYIKKLLSWGEEVYLWGSWWGSPPPDQTVRIWVRWRWRRFWWRWRGTSPCKCGPDNYWGPRSPPWSPYSCSQSLPSSSYCPAASPSTASYPEKRMPLGGQPHGKGGTVRHRRDLFTALDTDLIYSKTQL